MKKIFVLLVTVIFSLSAFTMAGCGRKNHIVEHSLTYNIEVSKYLVNEVIDGSFKLKVDSGIVIYVEYTVTGYDNYGNELWSQKFKNYYRGLEAQADPHEITFSYNYFHPESTGQLTNSVTVTDLKLKKQNSNEWMGWTFGAVSAVATVAVIALFVVYKLKSTSDKSSENTES